MILSTQLPFKLYFSIYFLIQYNLSPPLITWFSICVLILSVTTMSFSTSSSNSIEFDNQNHINMGAFGSNLGYIPRVPMPLGTSGAPIPNYPLPSPHLPYPPSFHISSGQLQVDSSPGNYVISSHSLPITGREYFPQVGNLSLSSQDSWSSGFTEVLQDNSRMSLG